MAQSVSGQRQMCLFDPSASLASALHSTTEEGLPIQNQPLLLPVHSPTQSGPHNSSVVSELHAQSSHLKRLLLETVCGHEHSSEKMLMS